MKRRHALLAGGSCLGMLLGGCSAEDETSETAIETTTPSGRSTPTPASTTSTTVGTPTATLTPGGTETSAGTNPRLTANDGDSRYFGGSIATSGTVAVVGAQDTESEGGGMAYAFERSNGSWSQQATLVPDSDDSSAARLPVAISGSTASVGPHLYARTDGSWIQETTLAPDQEVSQETRDISIAVDDDTAAVGDPNHGADGRVYVFHRTDDSWDHHVTLGHPDDEWGAGFGSAVAIAGDTLAIGSPADDISNRTDAGSVHVFTRLRGTWDSQTTLTPDGAAADLFGRAVSLSGDTMIVGAAGDEAAADDRSGSAYVFERTDGGWRRQAQLVPTVESQDGWSGHYGDAVAVAGDVALLSGEWSPTPQKQDGVEAVCLFSRDGTSWSQTRTLNFETTGVGAILGPVALSEETALIGAPLDSHATDSENQGAVYVYRLR